MSSAETPTTPTRATSAHNASHQLATPPTTEKKHKIVKLKVDARYASIHSRRSTSTLSQLVKHACTPKEAIAVALHPMYRGEQLDGSYYEWLLKLYDNQMPDIVRRINKFRGFPQQDDPNYNKEDAAMYQELYSTEEFRSELEQYMPYLRAYWNTCGSNFNAHNKVLETYHELSDGEDGRDEILFGFADRHITGELAAYVHALSQPPPPFDRTWKREMEDYPRDLLRSVKDKRFSDFEPEEASSDERNEHTTISEEAGPSASPNRLMEVPPTPGLLWFYRQTQLPLVSTPVFYRWPSNSPDYTPAPTCHLPSGVQYHSLAGDIAIPRYIPDDPRYAQIKARSDIQALATEMGFIPTDRLDSSIQDESHASEALSFPMGAFRPRRASSLSYGHGKSLGTVPAVNKRKRSDSNVETASNKRQRSDSNAEFAGYNEMRDESDSDFAGYNEMCNESDYEFAGYNEMRDESDSESAGNDEMRDETDYESAGNKEQRSESNVKSAGNKRKPSESNVESTGNKRKRSESNVELAGNKRQRSENTAESASSKGNHSGSTAGAATGRKQSRKRARGGRRRGGRKGKGGRKADVDGDEEFEYKGDDLNDDEKRYEKLRSTEARAPGTSRQARRRRAKKAAAAARAQPKVTAEDGHVKGNNTGKTDSVANN